MISTKNLAYQTGYESVNSKNDLWKSVKAIEAIRVTSFSVFINVDARYFKQVCTNIRVLRDYFVSRLLWVQ